MYNESEQQNTYGKVDTEFQRKPRNNFDKIHLKITDNWNTAHTLSLSIQIAIEIR